jgi:hypothetical protein
MTFDEEKDYIMRIIKEAARVLFALMLGKKYEENSLALGGMGIYGIKYYTFGGYK